MLINGIEVDFKIGRVSNAAALEKALQKMNSAEMALKGNHKNRELSAIISGTIAMIREFMRDAVGVDVLADCEDVDTAQGVYYAFLDNIVEQKKEYLSPYSPKRII